MNDESSDKSATAILADVPEAPAAPEAAAPKPVKPAGQERRTAPRRPMRTAVVLALKNGAMVMTRSFDISESGLGVVADHNLTPGQICTVAFQLVQRGAPSFQAQSAAIIAYSTFSGQKGGFALGLQFKSPSAALIEAIRRYMG